VIVDQLSSVFRNRLTHGLPSAKVTL
jgi:phosphonate transport system permease protein